MGHFRPYSRVYTSLAYTSLSYQGSFRHHFRPLDPVHKSIWTLGRPICQIRPKSTPKSIFGRLGTTGHQSCTHLPSLQADIRCSKCYRECSRDVYPTIPYNRELFEDLWTGIHFKSLFYNWKQSRLYQNRSISFLISLFDNMREFLYRFESFLQWNQK